MKVMRVMAAMAVIWAVGYEGGCKKSQSDAEAIRSAIKQHLVSLNTLNLQAMNMDVTNVSIQGGQAHAEVSFRPKTGAPEGAVMQVAYRLEKRGSEWTVVKTEGVGGGIQHPATGTNPHTQLGSSSTNGNLPNFPEFPAPPDPGASKSLPPGHPPVKTSPPPPQ